MRHLRLMLIAIATVLVLAMAAFALVSRPSAPVASDDDIIIKGGSLEIQCGKNHKTDNAGCLTLNDNYNGKYKHKQDAKHITKIEVRNSNNVTVFDSDTLVGDKKLGDKPEITIVYKAAAVAAQ
ncbi:MAG: hypothetical protein M3539_15830 [Acidobacteriota bacterium]|nr:hypothetical protein [Acidobacteriota bacterium]